MIVEVQPFIVRVCARLMSPRDCHIIGSHAVRLLTDVISITS